MNKQKILRKSRNYGILFSFVFGLGIIDFTKSEVFVLFVEFASILLWFNFVNNLVNYYENNKIDKLNIFLALCLMVVFFSDMFMGLGNSIGAMIVFIAPKIISSVLLFVLLVMLAKRTQVWEFYIVIFLLVAYGVIRFKISIFYRMKYEYAFYGLYFVILAILLFAILKFYKKESLHVKAPQNTL